MPHAFRGSVVSWLCLVQPVCLWSCCCCCPWSLQPLTALPWNVWIRPPDTHIMVNRRHLTIYPANTRPKAAAAVINVNDDSYSLTLLYGILVHVNVVKFGCFCYYRPKVLSLLISALNLF